ncbi:MAG TPA: NAD-dependent malic enzyme [Candidatus Dormibacteraeota bacterium]|nr:NAD-dependent malic enzyme [Candidatus Dormibacteraeota bacterium]
MKTRLASGVVMAAGKEFRFLDGHVATTLHGYDALHNPLLNKGTAFSVEERAMLGLTGLLPPAVKSLEQQAERAYGQYLHQPTDLARHVYLTSLHDRNEVLFYHLVTSHLSEMLPIVYTPTVAEAIEQYSHEYRRPRGVFLSIDHPAEIRQSFLNLGLGPDDVDLIVATDGERILGIGDWGVGGIDIAIGKLAVYTAAAGIHPARVIPVVLDAGTNRVELLQDEQYLGNRHARIRGERYDEFVDLYVRTAHSLFPNALLHWEDFGADNARRMLERYRDCCCTFNDDMQGTGAVVLAAVKSALGVTRERMRDQRVVLFGCGTAGIGIADQLRGAMIAEGLSARHATSNFWAIGRRGLITQGRAPVLRDFQRSYARPEREVTDWTRTDGIIDLEETIRRVHPTILIGVSTVAGAFTESVVREMAAHVERPIIFPLTNPTALSEAAAADLINWTDGRALIATGSPFAPVTYDGVSYRIGQANNAFVFPGIGLGTITVRATRVSNGMLAAAADAVAAKTDVSERGASLLPEVRQMREVSAAVAIAVARQAMSEGIARRPVDNLERAVRTAMWQPLYPEVVPAVTRRA